MFAQMFSFIQRARNLFLSMILFYSDFIEVFHEKFEKNEFVNGLVLKTLYFS